MDSKTQKTQRFKLNLLIERLSDRTGLKFHLIEEDTTENTTDRSKGINLDSRRVILQIPIKNILIVCEWIDPNPPDPLNRRLLEALAFEIFQDVFKEESGEGEGRSTWEKVIDSALVEEWDTETFLQRVRQYKLPRLELGYPVYIRCSAWPEELTQIMELFFPQAKVRWSDVPYLFLWIPVEDKETSRVEMRSRGESLIQEIHTLLADELGINSTILVGEATEGNLWEGFLGVRRLLEIHDRFFPGQPGLTAWSLGLSLLFSELPSQTHKDFIHKVLGTLPEELIETLETFLHHDLSISETAKTLFVHRNTLIYRLDRITDLTGYNPRRFLGAVHLYLALWLIKHQNSSK